MKQFLLGLFVCFIILSGVGYYLTTTYPQYDLVTLLFSNALLAIVFFLSFQINYKGLQKTHGESSVRAKMASTMLKFFVIIGAILIYILSKDKGTIHKPTIYFFGVSYVVYMVLETVLLSKIARNTKA
jgi:uncharacterized membrane-anchored protein